MISCNNYLIDYEVMNIKEVEAMQGGLINVDLKTKIVSIEGYH